MVQPGEMILVCDVGGGTTDFTLICLAGVDGSPRFERIAVGDHLILGGDNMDLALARQVEAKMSGRKASLSGDRWKALCHQCRQAKEAILGGNASAHRITLMGEGRGLIAGTMTAEPGPGDRGANGSGRLFPLVDARGRKRLPERNGITESGPSL